MIVDTMGLLLVIAVTSASVQDRAGGRTALARLAAALRNVSLVRADGGYANSVDSTLLSWARDMPVPTNRLGGPAIRNWPRRTPRAGRRWAGPPAERAGWP